MEILELALIVLACVIGSAVLCQVVPRLSLPLVQIAVGAVVALAVPAVRDVSISSELFLVLFIAPLLFNEARETNPRDRLEALREADAIVREEMEAANVGAWQYFAVVPDMRATGVRDGVRAYEWPAIIRAINTVDVMTAEVPELDWALLKRMTDRITHEVPGICRVCYDLTPKPVGTVEWE